MKHYLVLIFAILAFFIFGCSNSNQTSPQIPDNPGPEIAVTGTSEPVILGAGSMNLETGVTDPSRDLSGYLNVTPYVGPYFSWHIVDYDEEDWLEISLHLHNPTALTVYDVMIVFENTYGKETQGDGGVDIYQPYDIDPFVAFRKGDPARAFPTGSDDQTVWVSYPSGSDPRMNYFIVAHPGGNTGGVYGFEGAYTEGQLLETGGTATIYAYPLDHQDNVSYVVADTRVFTGELTFLARSGYPGEWTATFSNTKGAPRGHYEFWVGASSPAVPEYRTYSKAMLMVDREPKTMYVDDDNTIGPWDGTLAHPYQYVQDALDQCTDGDTIWIKPGTYYEDPGGDSSSPNAEITIPGSVKDLKIYGEGMPQIVLHDYAGTDNAAGIRGSSNENLVIDGLEFVPGEFYQYAINLSGCTNAQVKNCRVAPGINGFAGFMNIGSCTGAVVENNSCDGMICNTAIGNPLEIVNMNNSNNSKFTQNSIQGISQSAPGTSAVPSYEIEIVNIEGCDNSEVSKNKIGDFTWTSSNDYIAIVYVLRISFSEGSQVRNNLIHHVTQINLLVSGDSEIKGFEVGGSNSNVQIYNNTIDSLYMNAPGGTEGVSGIWIQQSNPMPDFYSNIISNLDSERSGSFIQGFGSGTSVTQSYSDVWNIVHGSGTRYYWNAVEGTGGLNVDPGFVDPGNNNYHLGTGSLCIGSGMGGVDMGCFGGTDPMP